MKSVIATQRVFRVRAGLGQKIGSAIWLRTAAIRLRPAPQKAKIGSEMAQRAKKMPTMATKMSQCGPKMAQTSPKQGSPPGICMVEYTVSPALFRVLQEPGLLILIISLSQIVCCTNKRRVFPWALIVNLSKVIGLCSGVIEL